MNSKLKDAHMDELFEGVLSLTSVEECYNFFEDLCTITELRAMAQRFQVAKMLGIEGRTYQRLEITEVLPPARHLVALADFYNVSVDYILGRTDKKEINR